MSHFVYPNIRESLFWPGSRGGHQNLKTHLRTNFQFCFTNGVSDFGVHPGKIMEPHKTPATPPSSNRELSIGPTVGIRIGPYRDTDTGTRRRFTDRESPGHLVLRICEQRGKIRQCELHHPRGGHQDVTGFHVAVNHLRIMQRSMFTTPADHVKIDVY